MTSAISGATGLQCGKACQAAAESVTQSVGKASGSWSTFGENLNKAAKAYEDADHAGAGKIGKAGEKTGQDGSTPAPNPGQNPADPTPGSPTGPQPINVGDVTYDKVNNPSGAQATQGYINQALDKLGITDPAARQRWSQAYMTLTQHESTYNPNAINDWDDNAKKSTAKVADGYGNWCSRGLAQCVPPTFAQYHQPGTSNNIYDPVANVAASMNYLMGHYGVSRDASNIFAKVGQTNPGTRQGY